MSSFETPPNLPLPAPTSFPLPALPLGNELSTPDERTLAMLAELLQLFSWIIGPLIIFLVKRDSRFVRFHALQAILRQVTMMGFYIIFFVIVIAIAVAQHNTKGVAEVAPFLIMMGFYAFFGFLSLGNFVIAIYFAVKANSGAWASYPVLGTLARTMVG